MDKSVHYGGRGGLVVQVSYLGLVDDAPLSGGHLEGEVPQLALNGVDGHPEGHYQAVHHEEHADQRDQLGVL